MIADTNIGQENQTISKAAAAKHRTNEFNANVGSRIKRKRLDQNLTRDKLAGKADISNKFLYEIESGKKGMSAETLLKIAQALEVSTDWLLGGLTVLFL